MYEKDTRATEVYRLKPSNPPGKVVIRKGSQLVVVWPGDLHELIDELIGMEFVLDTQHTVA